MNSSNRKTTRVFHGGCVGCAQQSIHGLKFCCGCQYFDADWSLPDLRNEQLASIEAIRIKLKKQNSSWGFWVRLFKKIADYITGNNVVHPKDRYIV